MDLTHASFFSGVGGLDLGLERAGWRTVSFSEIDPYANAVLAERWPGVPNLGDIVAIAYEQGGRRRGGIWGPADRWATATLWSGGFPCQDLSVAGKRAGFGGARSSLAFAFLDLVGRHRPPAILLENVPGLLSSHRGRDMAALVGFLAELGYGWAYRILDARHFGVPQRRRRVFIVALDLERGFTADRAAEVLSVGSRCARHPATGHATGEGTTNGTASSVTASSGHHGHSSPRGDGSDNIVHQAINAKWSKGYSGPAGDEHHNLTLSPPSDPGGVRAPDGLAGRVDDLAPTLRVGPQKPQDGGPGDTVPIIAAFRKSARPTEADGVESWVEDGLANTLNAFDTGDIRSTHIALSETPQPDPLLPLGLDSHRYRCCGNGVVSSVAEWIGLRLVALVESEAAA